MHFRKTAAMFKSVTLDIIANSELSTLMTL